MRNQIGTAATIIVFLLIEYYCFISVRTAIRNHNNTFKTIAYALYVVTTIIAWYCLFTFRTWDTQHWNPSVKVFMIAFVMGLLSAKVLVSLFMLIDDFRRLITFIIRFIGRFFPEAPQDPVEISNGISRSSFIARMAILAGGLLFSGFIWGTQNRYRYIVKRYKVPINRLPPAFKGLKIVHFSDVHAGSFDNPEAVQHGVDMMLKENADLIVFTGDLVNNKASEIEDYKHIFAQLKAPLGVYSTLGNHDYGDYVKWDSPQAKIDNLEALKQHHADMGWKLLMNEHVVFEKDEQKIALIGVENWSNMARFPKHGDLKKAYAGTENIATKILLSHDPTHWDAQIRPQFGDIDLTLSGHTHGMQFGLRLDWMQWSPVKYVYNQWAGLYTEAHQHINVNVGYGFLGYPGRLGILPEITVIELV
jgi:predicted MPP superfamily phosphohydrolase